MKQLKTIQLKNYKQFGFFFVISKIIIPSSQYTHKTKVKKQPYCGNNSDKELWSIGVRAGVSHAECVRTVVTKGRMELIFKLCPPNTLTTNTSTWKDEEEVMIGIYYSDNRDILQKLHEEMWMVTFLQSRRDGWYVLRIFSMVYIYQAEYLYQNIILLE